METLFNRSKENLSKLCTYAPNKFMTFYLQLITETEQITELNAQNIQVECIKSNFKQAISFIDKMNINMQIGEFLAKVNEICSNNYIDIYK